MRLLVLTALTVLLLPLQAPVHAEEAKSKGKPGRPDDQGQYKKPPAERPQPPTPKPSVYKPPPDNRPPDNRPPIKGHDDKKPPYQPPPDPRKKPILPPPPPQPWPPIGGGQQPGNDPCPPPKCPPRDIWIPSPEPCPPDPVIIPPPSFNMNAILTRKVNLMNVEGFVGQVVVGFGGGIEFNKAYSAGGYYDIGSAAEAFTAWAVYGLVDAGRLGLTTTLAELFPNAPPDKRAITIEQLLGHTSGLGSSFAADGEGDRDVAIDKLLAEPLAQPPGTDFLHSDDGYVILAAAIEVASGMPYEDYMLEGVVDRHMEETLFWNERHDSNWGKRGAGGILSTAEDLYSWTSRFVDQPTSITDELMRPRAWTDEGVGIGYGWFCDNSSDAPIRWTNGTGETDENVTIVVYPAGAILVVTSDRYRGDVPWSERVANTLEPILWDWAPAPHPYPGRIVHPVVVRSTATASAR